jgi:hypothetical protein
MAHATAEESAAKRRKLMDECAGAEAPANVPAAAACLRMREKILAVERDYTHYFALDVGGEAGADQYVYQHFNTLCMVGIAPSSLAFAGGRKVTQVDFAVGRGGADKTGNKFSEVLYVVTLLSEYSRALTFKNLCKRPRSLRVRRSMAQGACSIPLRACVMCARVPYATTRIPTDASAPARGSFLNESSRLCDLVCDDGTRIKVRCAIQGHLLELNTRLQENPDLLNSKVYSSGIRARSSAVRAC